MYESLLAKPNISVYPLSTGKIFLALRMRYCGFFILFCYMALNAI